MPVTITITGQTADEAHHELRKFANYISVQATIPAAVHAAATEAVVEAPLDQPQSGASPAVASLTEAPSSTTITETSGTATAVTEKPARKPRTKKAEEAKPLISTDPENRANPEDEAQDAADEAAEREASRTPEKAYTADDVRSALGEYVAKYGMAAAQEDGPKLLALAFGESVKTISAIPATPENYAKAVAGAREMTAKNPYNRKAV